MPEDDFSAETQADVYVKKVALEQAVSDLGYDGDPTGVHREYMSELVDAPAASAERMPAQAENSEFFQRFENELRDSQEFLDSLVDRNGERLTDADERVQLMQDATSLETPVFQERYADSGLRINTGSDENVMDVEPMDVEDLQFELIDRQYAITESGRLQELIDEKVPDFTGDIEASSDPETEISILRADLEDRMARAAMMEARSTGGIDTVEHAAPTVDDQPSTKRQRIAEPSVDDLEMQMADVTIDSGAGRQAAAADFDGRFEDRSRDDGRGL